jgi:hypothetical protein
LSGSKSGARREGTLERPQDQPPGTYDLAHPSSVGCFTINKRRGSGEETPRIRRPGLRWEAMAGEVAVRGGAGEIGSRGREIDMGGGVRYGGEISASGVGHTIVRLIFVEEIGWKGCSQ